MSVDVRGMAPLIQVFDMPTALGFYRDVLGFEIVASAGPEPNFGWVLLRLYGVEVMLNTAYEDDARPPSRTGRASRRTAIRASSSIARTWMRYANGCARTASR